MLMADCESRFSAMNAELRNSLKSEIHNENIIEGKEREEFILIDQPTGWLQNTTEGYKLFQHVLTLTQHFLCLQKVCNLDIGLYKKQKRQDQDHKTYHDAPSAM